MNIEHMKKALIEYAKENRDYVDKTYGKDLLIYSHQEIQMQSCKGDADICIKPCINY